MQTIAVTEIKGIEQTLLNESNALISSDVATDSTMLGKDNSISNSNVCYFNAFFSLNKNMKRGWIGGKIEKVRYLLYMEYQGILSFDFLLDMVLILAYII